MKLKMMILSLLCGIAIHQAKAQDGSLAKSTESIRLTATKTIDVGEFKQGEGWIKRAARGDLITTSAQLKAFYVALGKKEADVPEIDFGTTILYLDTWPSWNRNERFNYFTLDGKGDLEIGVASTEKKYWKPKKGPYFTSIRLIGIPRKGVKTYTGKPLAEFKPQEQREHEQWMEKADRVVQVQCTACMVTEIAGSETSEWVRYHFEVVRTLKGPESPTRLSFDKKKSSFDYGKHYTLYLKKNASGDTDVLAFSALKQEDIKLEEDSKSDKVNKESSAGPDKAEKTVEVNNVELQDRLDFDKLKQGKKVHRIKSKEKYEALGGKKTPVDFSKQDLVIVYGDLVCARGKVIATTKNQRVIFRVEVIERCDHITEIAHHFSYHGYFAVSKEAILVDKTRTKDD